MKPVTVHSTEDPIEALDRWLSVQHRKGRFNGSVLIRKNGETVYAQHFGFRDIQQTLLIDEDTAFNLASVSKQFTAFAILQLAYHDHLNLDDPISKLIPEFGFGSSPTLRDLLHHQSGLAEYFKLPDSNPTLQNPMTNDQVVENLAAFYKTRNPPKAVLFKYSNSGYIVLANIIERVSGLSFEEYMREYVFIPSGLKNTRVFNQISEQPITNKGYGFRRTLGGNLQGKDLNEWDGVAGDGGVYSTAQDLLTWHESLMTGKLIPAYFYAQAMKPSAVRGEGKSSYGMGWFILEDGIVDHAGGWRGFSSYFYRDAVADNVIVMLDNATHSLSMAPYGTRWNSLSLNVRNWLSY